MVGVPGRFEGCDTNRQRKDTCGEAKPICTRYFRGGHVFQGYDRDAQWLHCTTEPGRYSQFRLGRLVEIENANAVDATGTKTAAQITLLPFPKSISLAAFQDTICFSYIFSNFVWRGYGSSWLKQNAEGDVGQLAFDSGCREHRKSLPVRDIIERFEAGKKNKRDLSNLVIPILLLLMHSITAVMFHLQAITHIFTTCGPKAFQHQPLRDAYEAAMAALVVASLIHQKRTFSDGTRWHIIGMYASMPMSKPTQSYLWDILAAVPGFLEECNNLEVVISEVLRNFILEPGHHDFTAIKSDILERIKTKLELLFVWRLHWQHAFGLAADIALYNAVLMWLLALVNEFEPLRAEAVVEGCAVQAQANMLDISFSFTSLRVAILRVAIAFEPLSAFGTVSRPRDAAEEICRVYEWQSGNHTSAGWETNPLYLFPISLAMCMFDMHPAHSRNWIRTMLDAHELTKDYGVGCNEINPAGSHTGDKNNNVPIDGKPVVVTAGRLEVEIGVLHRLQTFGWYVTRELSSNVAGQGDQSHHRRPKANLLHLLIIQGRTDMQTYLLKQLPYDYFRQEDSWKRDTGGSWHTSPW
ncbi:hypothetical protein F5Y18DRAFT_442281 [Xylariaceae sp. FL1019]|nr:hypothetical protein F5Y18DRAFT_442281 [Xylariaceae sp. FL1019]